MHLMELPWGCEGLGLQRRQTTVKSCLKSERYESSSAKHRGHAAPINDKCWPLFTTM